MGPKPNNVGTFLAYVLDEAVAQLSPRLKVYFSTPGVQVIKTGDKVTGVVGRLSNGSYVRFNASKAVILATGDYQNNPSMVKRWCPDVSEFDKKQFDKTGDNARSRSRCWGSSRNVSNRGSGCRRRLWQRCPRWYSW